MMTRMVAAESLTAGRKLDALVAEKAMGWTVEVVVGHEGKFEAWRDPQGWRYGPDPKPYSTDIAAAWQVVERLPAKFALVKWMGGWSCSTASGDAHADTAPLAICRAALRAFAPETFS